MDVPAQWCIVVFRQMSNPLAPYSSSKQPMASRNLSKNLSEGVAIHVMTLVPS